jgi:hypothetical protein
MKDGPERHIYDEWYRRFRNCSTCLSLNALRNEVTHYCNSYLTRNIISVVGSWVLTTITTIFWDVTQCSSAVVSEENTTSVFRFEKQVKQESNKK